MHRHVVDEHVFELDVGVVLVDVVDDLAPNAAGLEDVGFVDAGHLAAALLGELERGAANALDLEFAVAHHVVAFTAVLALADAFFAEVDAADQLAHDEHVDVLCVFERADVGERVEQFGGAKVGVKPHRLAHAEQRALGALFVRQRVVLRPSDRAQQHAVAVQALVEALLGERLTVFVVGGAAANAVFEIELVPELCPDLLKHADRARSDLGTYPVAGYDGDVVCTHILPQIKIYPP